jgi:putative ATPase
LFIDEIHRFNKLQQDALLPFVEDGTVIMCGATTENPYFEVNKALISRSMVIKLNPLSHEEIFKILKNAISNKEGLGEYNIKIEDDTLKKIAQTSNGDVRTALNGLEVAVLTTVPSENGVINITDKIAGESVGKKKAIFDKNGDSHYDNISAFIKSMRGSDPDATVFYLARLIAGGEDPVFIARRIVIAAAEDVGLANPNALVVATSAMQAVTMIGMPEARILLSEAAIYIALSKKSNCSYIAINKALEDEELKDTGEIPMHIRNSSVNDMKNFGYGSGYKYPHDYPEHMIVQQYLPDKMVGTKYFIKDETVDI